MALRRKTAYEEWAARYRSGKLAPKDGATMSGVPLQPLYTPDDLEGWNYDEKLGYPGEFPYTRGVYPSICLLYTSPSPRDLSTSRMPASG